MDDTTANSQIAAVGTDSDTSNSESVPPIKSSSMGYLRGQACAPLDEEQGFFVEARMNHVPVVDMTKIQDKCKHVLHRTFFFGILPLIIRTLEEWRRRWGTLPRVPPTGLLDYLAAIMDYQTNTLLPDNLTAVGPPCVCPNFSSLVCVKK